MRCSIPRSFLFQPLYSLYSVNYVRSFADLLPGHAVLFFFSLQRTDADARAFLKANLFPGTTDAQVDSIADKYSQDPAAVGYLPLPPGSPS